MFQAPAVLRLYLAGYLSKPDLRLSLNRISDNAELLIRPVRDAHETWVLHEFPLPSSWIGSQVRLKATDNAQRPGGWFAFSELVTANKDAGGRDALNLLLRTLVNFIVLFLPCFAVCAAVLRRRARNLVLLGLVALSTTGASGYLIFWLYFLSPWTGHALAFLIPVLSLAYLVWAWIGLLPQSRSLLRKLLVPVSLTGAAALVVLSAGFLYGGVQDPLFTGSVRFSHPLPPDNSLPYLLAEDLRLGSVPKPFFIDWLSSDRPPLQAGIALAQSPFSPKPRDFGYTVVSVIAQSLWIFALWLLLATARINQRAVALALLTCLLTGFVFVNSFFVWPKLLAAAYTLGLLAALAQALIGPHSRDKTLLSVVAASLLAWTLLSHGGSAFAVIGIAIVSLFLIRRASPKRLAAVLGLAFVLYLPWMSYQEFFDPPGNRTLKYHLAGVESVDPRPFGETLVSAYRQLSLKQVVDNKLSNFDVAAVDGFDFCTQIPRLLKSLIAEGPESPSAVRLAGQMRGQAFFLLWACLGFLIVGPFLLFAGIARKFRTREWKAALLFWNVIAVSILIWCLLMFGPAKTVLHQGTYATVLLALSGSVLACWAANAALAYVVCGLQIVLNVVLYVVLMRGAADDVPLAEGFFRPWMLILSLLSLAMVFWLITVLARREEIVGSKPLEAENLAIPVER
ncbi:MAG: hypothetical protein JO033_17260 [Acidobacteriaceae bacterium]|nr:hypothetical protein [Acidobacteriaceae bacterium]